MHKIIATLLFFIPLLSWGQKIKNTRDFGSWIGVTLEKKLPKKFDWNLELQSRFNENSLRFNKAFVETGFGYKIDKNFKLSSGIRYSFNAPQPWKEPENQFRYHLDFRYKGRISKKLDFSYRLRYQQSFIIDFMTILSPNETRSNVRNKIKFKYKLQEGQKVYSSLELFRLNKNFQRAYFNKIRFYLGHQFKLKKGEIDYAFGYEQEIQTVAPSSFFFLKVNYTLAL